MLRDTQERGQTQRRTLDGLKDGADTRWRGGEREGGELGGREETSASMDTCAGAHVKSVFKSGTCPI